MEIGTRCKIKNTTFFGSYYGKTEDPKYVWFYDEEIGKLRKIKVEDLRVVTYE